jgi:hypothetical protein
MLHEFHHDGLLNEESLLLGFLRYDLHDLPLVLFFWRRDHGEPRSLHLPPHHAVDDEPRLVVLDDDGNSEHFREHYDHLGDDDDVRIAHGEQHFHQCLHLCGIQRLPSFLVVA